MNDKITLKKMQADDSGELSRLRRYACGEAYEELEKLILDQDRVESLLREAGKHEAADILARLDNGLWKDFAINSVMDTHGF